MFLLGERTSISWVHTAHTQPNLLAEYAFLHIPISVLLTSPSNTRRPGAIYMPKLPFASKSQLASTRRRSHNTTGSFCKYFLTVLTLHLLTGLGWRSNRQGNLVSSSKGYHCGGRQNSYYCILCHHMDTVCHTGVMKTPLPITVCASHHHLALLSV